MLSIIICTYNQETTIARTIEGVLRQESDEPFEVIIGDDCSTDGTAMVCQTYVNKYPEKVRLFSWPQNKGVLDNYYSCIREARGEYIMECGGDDEWCAGRINLCLGIMRQHPEVVQVLTNMYHYYSKTGEKHDGTATYTTEGVVGGRDNTLAFLKAKGAIPGHFAMTRRNAIMRLMEEYPHFFCGREYKVEDLQLAVLVGTQGDIYYTPASTYFYTRDGDSLYQTPDDRKKYWMVKNCTLLRHDLAEAIGLSHSEMQPTYTYYLYVMMMHAFRIHDKELRDDARAFARQMGAGGNWRYTLARLVMSNDVTWAAMLGVRRLFVAVKVFLTL